MAVAAVTSSFAYKIARSHCSLFLERTTRVTLVRTTNDARVESDIANDREMNCDGVVCAVRESMTS